MAHSSPYNRISALVIGLCTSMSSAAAWAQTCPAEYSACDNEGCCLSSEQCCPRLEDGCCSSATPYCCGDGRCAATPSGCNATTLVECDGYDVPCGGGCAPAGSDCCDLAGHYCPPESSCTSDIACVLGDMETLARLVAISSVPEDQADPRLVSPPSPTRAMRPSGRAAWPRPARRRRCPGWQSGSPRCWWGAAVRRAGAGPEPRSAGVPTVQPQQRQHLAPRARAVRRKRWLWRRTVLAARP